MAAKGKGKGKTLLIADADLQKYSTKQHEGALDNQFFVNTQMKDASWHKARIIDCRLSKDYDIRTQKNDSSYEYYIHYEGFNRRMDEWVARSRIVTTEELVQEEPSLKKKSKKNEEKKEVHQENDEHEGMDQQSLQTHEMITRFKTIETIQFGKFTSETWYYSPYPQGYHNIQCLFICEYCLLFFVSKNGLARHSEICKLRHPPGDEIYKDRDLKISVFEVDGHKNPTYCENLCYLAKLFLDHKNLYYDVDPFLFYILTEHSETGHHLVGYFSKEKESSQGYNLSCILTLPFYQRKGYGKFLITFSYELSLIDQKIGTPERPLSDLGKESYLSWWIQRIIDYLKNRQDEEVTLANITKHTGIKDTDILWTLEQKGIVKYSNGNIILNIDPTHLDQVYKKAGRPGLAVKKEYLHWVPYKVKWDVQPKQYGDKMGDSKILDK